MASEYINDAEKQRDIARRDLNDELIGAENGRQIRFFPEASRMAESRKQKEKRDHEQVMTELMQRMMDPAYAALYSDTYDLLTKAETASEKILTDLDIELDVARFELAQCKDSANRLPDGALVFMDKNGNMRHENGGIIEDTVLLESIVRKSNAPTYEDYLEKRNRITKLERDIDELRRYQVDVLGDAREKMTDEDNPASKEELKKIQEDIFKRAPPALKRDLELESVATNTVTNDPKNTASIAVLKM